MQEVPGLQFGFFLGSSCVAFKRSLDRETKPAQLGDAARGERTPRNHFHAIDQGSQLDTNDRCQPPGEAIRPQPVAA